MTKQKNMNPKANQNSNWLRHAARVSPLVLALSLGATGCLGDKNQDDYRAGQVDQELAKYQGIKGDYRGEGVSADGRQGLGLAVLTISPEAQVSRSSDNLKYERQVIIRGTLLFTSGEMAATLNFTQGYFNDSTGVFEASLPLQTTNGSFQGAVAKISGVIRNGEFSGTIQGPANSTDPAYTIELNLAKDAPARVNPGMTHGRSREAVAPIQSYTGMTTLAGSPAKVTLMMKGREISGEQNFANLVLPSRDLDATLHFEIQKGSTVISTDKLFQSSHLDYTSNKLRGQASDAVSSRSLDCDRHVSGGVTRGWTCTFIVSGGEGTRLTVELTPEGGR